ncbi:MAG: hypothetical protein AUK34_05945 [Ignavibacteria bacterium CG2_30_36_16]|nr:hypothetical protein [Ignavibacteria bacterium]OIP60892.1 MAG: hypothetical protein AUK34_05945 [Ignavibacteria bacterium CG2_30_36_16]PJB01846.1 MAG: hypothetical protein CO127_01710 [Ignavibacteria bacterium CG_4_9_14_3_um_filter_36_18]
MLKIFYLITITITAAVLFVIGCNKSSPPTEPPPDEVKKDTVSTTVKDVTHRSVSINVQCTMNNLQWKVSLYRTLNGVDTLVAFFPVTVKDTTIIDDNNGNGLMLDTEYKYYAALTDTAGKLQEKTEPITAKTLAPTSHNFTWQEFTIGDANYPSNLLYDVWGTDENNVWAVGGVSINGQTYGALHWNGSEWLPDSGAAGGYAIYGFGANDIWIVGGRVYHFDGIKWNWVDGYSSGGQNFPIDTVLFNNIPYTFIWGTSSSNLYLGNQWGKIIHWNGTEAKVIYTLNDARVTSISGNDENNFIITAISYVTQSKTKVIKVKYGSWADISNNEIRAIYPMASAVSNEQIYIGGNNLFSYQNNRWDYIPLNIVGHIEDIFIEKTNNIFAVGSLSVVFHYNGIDWHEYTELQTDMGSFSAVYSTPAKVFLVGRSENNSPKLYIGTK